MTPLLEVKNLKKYFKTAGGTLHAVDNVSFTLDRGRTLGVVGESGCGKSTLSKAILGFVKTDSGEIIHHTECPQMIFQDPYASLNPSKKISWIMEEPLRMQHIPAAERRKRVQEMAERIGLSQEQINRYPGELSGGQRQRVASVQH